MTDDIDCTSDDGERFHNGPMSAEELADIREHRGDPTYMPAESFDPLHQNWTDNQIQLLAPFFHFTSPPPSLEEIDRIIANHPVNVAQPGGKYHRDVQEWLAMYCFRKSEHDLDPSWRTLGITLCEREGFKQVLRMFNAEINS